MIVTIIGIGQRLRGDDEVGLAAVELWVENYSGMSLKPDLRVIFAESPGVGLLHLLEDADAAILVDAVQSGAQPGDLHIMEAGDLVAFLDGSDSAHGWGVAETLSLGAEICPESLPEKIIILGIEIRQVNLGAGISPEVHKVLPTAAKLIQEHLKKITVS